LTTQLQNEEEEEEELRGLMINQVYSGFLFVQEKRPEALPCFEVPVLEGTVA
jgi:hypothetical protein